MGLSKFNIYDVFARIYLKSSKFVQYDICNMTVEKWNIKSQVLFRSVNLTHSLHLDEFIIQIQYILRYEQEIANNNYYCVTVMLSCRHLHMTKRGRLGLNDVYYFDFKKAFCVLIIKFIFESYCYLKMSRHNLLLFFWFSQQSALVNALTPEIVKLKMKLQHPLLRIQQNIISK